MDESSVVKSSGLLKPSARNKAWDQEIPFAALSWPVAWIIVVALSALCFHNCVHGDFVFDDSEAIVNNQDVRTSSPLSNILVNDFWGTKLTHPSSHKSYRPLTILSFRWNYYVGSLDPYGYHVVNVVLHCMVGVLSLQVFSVIFGVNTPRATLLASILFATHPIHTEAVCGVVGRADLLCALFVFLAFVCYVKAVESGSLPRGHTSWRESREGYLYMLMVGVWTGVAMLCKEVGITGLGLCSAYDLLIAHSGVLTKVLVHNEFTKLPGGVVRRHFILVVYGLTMLVVRWQVMGSSVPKFTVVDNPASFMDSAFFRAINYQYIYGLNVVLVMFPLWLCFDWSMGCIPVISSLMDGRVLLVPLLWVGGGLLAYRALWGTGRTSRHVMMSLAMGVIPFLPASNVFFRVGFVIAERVLYIPVAGLCVLIVSGMQQLSAHRVLSKRCLQVLYIALVGVFVVRCRQRSGDWLTEKQLFTSGLRVCPLNAKVHYNIGKVAADEGHVQEAILRYREALRLNTHYDQAMNNLANILKDQGKLEEALKLLQNATSIRSDFAAAWMNLGIVQASLGQHTQAHLSYRTALSHRSVYPDCLYNLGNLYLEMGEHSRALDAWTQATTLKPTLAVAWTNMLIFLDSDGQLEEAVHVAHKALQHLPREATIHFNLANTLGKLGRYDQSEKHFLLATEMEPLNANYWSNLGVLYHRWKKYELAERAYRHTLSISPGVRSAHDNLSMLLKTMAKGRP